MEDLFAEIKVAQKERLQMKKMSKKIHAHIILEKQCFMILKNIGLVVIQMEREKLLMIGMILCCFQLVFKVNILKNIDILMNFIFI